MNPSWIRANNTGFRIDSIGQCDGARWPRTNQVMAMDAQKVQLPSRQSCHKRLLSTTAKGRFI